MPPRFLIVACLIFCLPGITPAQTVDSSFFEKKIRPVLVDQCQSCHGDKKQKSGLRVDSLQALLTGGESGPSLVPRKPDESLLIKVIEQGEPYAMPPKGKLPREQMADLRTWVKAGAPWPGATAGSVKQNQTITQTTTRRYAPGSTRVTLPSPRACVQASVSVFASPACVHVRVHPPRVLCRCLREDESRASGCGCKALPLPLLLPAPAGCCCCCCCC